MNDSSALLDLYDVRKALTRKEKQKPKDSEGSTITIGDCLDDAILFLESLEINTHKAFPPLKLKTNLIFEAIEFFWGGRCPEREEGCLVCEAWQQYDNINGKRT